MAALTARRITRPRKAKTMSLPGTAEQVYEGGLACWDTSTGLITKGQASTTLIAVGVFAETKTVGAGEEVLVELFRETEFLWCVNSAGADEVTAASLGSVVYVVDDQTVADNDGTNTRSALGRAWSLDTSKGVLVELFHTASN